MVLAEKTLGVNLVNLFGARGARCKPAVLGDYLDSADDVAVARGLRKNLLDFFACDFGDLHVAWRQFCESGFLCRCGGCFNAFVNWVSQVAREFAVDFAWILSQTRGDFRREQARDDSVLIRGPDSAVTADKRRAGALLARETQTAGE